MLIKNTMLIATSTLCLSGCMTANDFALRCQNYGYQEGTQQFAACMQSEQQAYSQAFRNLGQQLSANSQAQPVYMPPPTHAITKTNCQYYKIGNSASCTSY